MIISQQFRLKTKTFVPVTIFYHYYLINAGNAIFVSATWVGIRCKRGYYKWEGEIDDLFIKSDLDLFFIFVYLS